MHTTSAAFRELGSVYGSTWRVLDFVSCHRIKVSMQIAIVVLCHASVSVRTRVGRACGHTWCQ